MHDIKGYNIHDIKKRKELWFVTKMRMTTTTVKCNHYQNQHKNIARLTSHTSRVRGRD